MAEELQSLIERIQQEGVSKAQAEADAIISGARQRAAQIVKEAEEQASAKLKQAEQDAALFMERSRKTLEQAARDLLITVGQGVENILKDIVAGAVKDALSVTVLENMLVKMAEAYVVREGGSGQINLLVSPQDQQALVKFFATRYRQKIGQGVQLHVDNNIFKGFKIAFVEDHLCHDFTAPAIAEALMNLLRPNLAEIVHRAARNGGEKGGGAGKRPVAG